MNRMRSGSVTPTRTAESNTLVRALHAVALALILLAALKMCVVVFSSPIMGYANNYDFVRQSSCIGLWQAYADKPKTAGSPEAPVNSLLLDGQRMHDVCMHSSDNVFPFLATLFHAVGEKVDFREISLWKLVFAGIGLAVLLANTPGATARLGIAAAFLLVFGDFANLLYANTLYLEFSVILGGFFSLLCAAILIAAETKPRRLFIAFSLLALGWLGLSKQQYMPLAALLALFMAAVAFLRWRAQRATSAFVLVALLIPLAYALLNNDGAGHMRFVNFANKTDTFLWAVLPEARDQEAALAVLGLPASCAAGIGRNWYAPGIQENHPCPEVKHASRIGLVELFFRDPATFIQPMRKGIEGLRPFYPTYIGHLEDSTDAASPSYVLLRETSLSSLAARLPANAFLELSLLSMSTGPLLLVPLTRTRGDADSRFALALIGLGGVATLYAVGSSVFGDGYVELQKHAVAFMSGVAFQMTGLMLALLRAALHRLMPWP